jgi:hypothetical protein
MTKRSTFIAALCGLALVGAGCGGDDDNDTLSYDDTGTEIGKACESVDTTGLNGEPANDAPLLDEVISQFETAIQDVRDLDVNEELEADRDAFADNGDEQLAVIKEAKELADEGDQKAYQDKIQGLGPLDAESDEIASRLGAEACMD